MRRHLLYFFVTLGTATDNHKFIDQPKIRFFIFYDYDFYDFLRLRSPNARLLLPEEYGLTCARPAVDLCGTERTTFNVKIFERAKRHVPHLHLFRSRCHLPPLPLASATASSATFARMGY